MRKIITITPTIPVARLQKFAGRNLNRWINRLIESAIDENADKPRRHDVRIPNPLTARTLHSGKSGKGIKHFRSKKELYTDLGL